MRLIVPKFLFHHHFSSHLHNFCAQVSNFAFRSNFHNFGNSTIVLNSEFKNFYNAHAFFLVLSHLLIFLLDNSSSDNNNRSTTPKSSEVEVLGVHSPIPVSIVANLNVAHDGLTELKPVSQAQNNYLQQWGQYSSK